MELLEIAHHAPGEAYTTEELLDAFPLISNRLQRIIRRRLGVTSRHAVISLPDLLANRIQPKQSCSQLGAAAAHKCLTNYGVTPQDVDLLIAATDTNDYICPSLSALLIPQIGLSPYIANYNLGGMGCSALIKAMDIAQTYLSRYPDHLVLVVASEVQSAFVDDVARFSEEILSFGEIKRLDVAEETRQRLFRQTLSMIQLFLFGDGAVAMLFGRNKNGPARFICSSHVTNMDPADATLVYFAEGGSLYPNLSRGKRPLFTMKTDKVASRGSEYGAKALQQLLVNPQWPAELTGLSDVSEWLLHPGSKIVLDTVSSSINKLVAQKKSKWLEMMPKLNRDAIGLSASYHVLAKYGNLSGVALGFILADILNSPTRRPEPGAYGILLGFGAGFSCSTALIQF